MTKPARINVTPNRPPRTSREFMQLLIGEPHAGPGHGVWVVDVLNLAIKLWCVCGKSWTLDMGAVHKAGITWKEATDSLRGAPCVASWGSPTKSQSKEK